MSSITSWFTRVWVASWRPRRRASRSFAATREASQLVTPAVAKNAIASSPGWRKLAVGASSWSTQYDCSSSSAMVPSAA